MRNILTVLLILTNSVFIFPQQDFEEYQRSQQDAYNQYVTAYSLQYEQFETQERQRFEEFKRQVEEKWQEFKGSTQKTFVDYESDLGARRSVDFETGEVTVEVIIEADLPEPENTVQEKLQQNIERLIKTDADDGQPLLADQLSDNRGNTVQKSEAKSYAREIVKNTPSVKKEYVAKDGIKRKAYIITIPLKSNHLSVRAERYKKEIIKQSIRFNIDPAIAFAIVETESAFNPKAKSHVPAYGLMQLVPKSGARDAYNYVYKKDKYLGPDYLYQPKNNIELGCAYFAKIRYDYFKGITDDEKAYICSVPAYNTGIGNVAKTLTGKSNLKRASKKANQMSSKKLYDKLANDLKHKEARDYLKRVWERKDKYKG